MRTFSSPPCRAVHESWPPRADDFLRTRRTGDARTGAPTTCRDARRSKGLISAETGQAVLARANRPVSGAPPVKPDFATQRERRPWAAA